MKFVDMHCHILPDLDDGAKDMEETRRMLKIAEEQGITDIIVTPHYRPGHFRSSREEILASIERVQEVIDRNNIAIRLYPGCEVFYRSEIGERLEDGSITTMNDTEYVLVEFSPREDYRLIRNAVEDIFAEGYTPIVAHVERYDCMVKHPEYVEELKAIGCLIQVNAASITGEVSFLCKRYVHKLLKQELVDFVGTDSHNDEGRKPALAKCAKILYRKYDEEYADALLFGNAKAYLLS